MITNRLENEGIHILLLGDDSAGIKILDQNLKRAKLDFQLTVVADKEHFKKLINNKNNAFDIIISALSHPQFSGLEAVKIIRKKDQVIPFIFLANTITIETAIELMRSGANDLLLKDRMKEMPKIILHLVEEARMKMAALKYETELNDRNGILRTLMESVTDLIYFKDLEGRYVEVNSGFCQFFGLSQQQVIGKPDKSLYDEDLWKQINKSDIEVLKKKVPLVFELNFVSKGKRHILETVKAPLRDEQGEIIGIAGVTRDVTMKKLDEEALRTNQQLLTQSEKQSLSGSFKFNLENTSLYCSQQFLENLGLSGDEKIISLAEFLERIYGAEREIFEIELRRSINEQTEFYMEHRSMRQDDEEIIYCKTHIIPDTKTKGIYYGVMTNVSKDRQLRKVILDIQEKERKNIASNLHDNLGQKLVAAKMFLSQSDENSLPLQRANKLINQSIEEIRSLSRSLSLHTIQGFGLKSAIEDVLSTFPVSLEINSTLNFQEEDLNEEITTQVFRIIQEGITNILKYAEASVVEVSIERENNFLNLIISDNGVGFDPDLESKGIGIKNILERVARCNGFIEILSGKKGTDLKIKLPIK